MTTRARAVIGVVAVLSVLSLGVAASLAAPARSLAVPPGYTGIEAKLPTQYKVPRQGTGRACTIGFQNPIAANETLSASGRRRSSRRRKAFGCKVITLDDALDPGQAGQQHAAAARAEGERDHLLPARPEGDRARADAGEEQGRAGARGRRELRQHEGRAAELTSQVWQGRDIQAFLQAQALAKAKPGGQVGLIGIGIPVPALKYLNVRESFWAKKAGLTVVGTQDNPSDDVTGGEKAANGLLQRYSDMDSRDRLQRPERARGGDGRTRCRPEPSRSSV